MVDNLKRIREPLSWALIAVIGVGLVLGVIQLVLLLNSGDVAVFEAFQDVGDSFLNLPAVLALVALVCLCFFVSPAVPRARLLTLVAASVASLGVLLTLVSWGLGVAASANTLGVVMEFLGGLVDLLLKALAAGALWVLLRGVGAGRIDTASPVPDAGAALESMAEAGAARAASVWQRTEALGSAWRTADDAAHGRPGAPSITGSSTGSSTVSITGTAPVAGIHATTGEPQALPGTSTPAAPAS